MSQRTLGSEKQLPRTLERERLFTIADVKESFSPTHAEHLHRVGTTRIYSVCKRSLDIVIGVLALWVLLPLIALVAALIKLEDGGPVLYCQQRVGQFGRVFNFYKFRSMRVDADKMRSTLEHMKDSQGVAFKMKKDPRRTRIGAVIRKLSLDEVPQFISVILGDLSVIGPRPHLPHEVETYTRLEWERLTVKPGLVCLREIRGRSDLSFDEWLKLDLEYVQSKSLLLDCKIFLLAIPAVLSCKGAY